MVMVLKGGFAVVAGLRSLPERVDELRGRLHRLTELTRLEDGRLRSELIENGCDATEFTLLQEWSNERAQTAHFGTGVIRSALRNLQTLLSGELDERKRVLRANAVRYGTNSYGQAVR